MEIEACDNCASLVTRFRGEREENDEELKARIALKAKQARQLKLNKIEGERKKEQKEKELYESLKKKFGS